MTRPEIMKARKALEQAETFYWDDDPNLYFQKAQALALIVIAEELARANEEWT